MAKTIKYFPAPAPAPRKKIRRLPEADSLRVVTKRLFLFAVALFLGGFSCYAFNEGQLRFENFLYAQISQPLADSDYPVFSHKKYPEMEIAARAAYSLRIGATGREKTIFKKNTEQPLPIASITKLVSAAVVLENPEIYDLNARVTISRQASEQDDVPIFGNLKPGESYTVRELLNLMLFYSSNDAAVALSEVMGSEKFIVTMNQTARNLGLANTVFYNSSGLDIDGGQTNLSTAGDLMVLVKYLMDRHPEILSYTTMPVSSLTENGIFAVNLWDGQRLIGGKTGYTEKAGGCMVLILENEKKRRYVHIILGSSDSETRVAEMQKLVNSANNAEHLSNK